MCSLFPLLNLHVRGNKKNLIWKINICSIVQTSETTSKSSSALPFYYKNVYYKVYQHNKVKKIKMTFKMC